MSLITSLQEESTLPNAVAPDWLLGWRYERVRRADGREIEITSPATRETDRVKKVKDYALVGVHEYIYTHERQKVTPNAGVIGYFLCCS